MTLTDLQKRKLTRFFTVYDQNNDGVIERIDYIMLADIGLLNDLWRGFVPVIFFRWENTILKVLKEAFFDIGKGLIKGELFTQPIFALEPNIFNRVLLGRIGSEKNTSHLPFILRESSIEFSKIISHLSITMITRAVPNQP